MSDTKFTPVVRLHLMSSPSMNGRYLIHNAPLGQSYRLRAEVSGPLAPEIAPIFAAAPDMYRALRAWVESTSFDEQTGSMAPVYQAARAAIAKAEGR